MTACALSIAATMPRRYCTSSRFASRSAVYVGSGFAERFLPVRAAEVPIERVLLIIGLLQVGSVVHGVAHARPSFHGRRFETHGPVCVENEQEAIRQLVNSPDQLPRTGGQRFRRPLEVCLIDLDHVADLVDEQADRSVV